MNKPGLIFVMFIVLLGGALWFGSPVRSKQLSEPMNVIAGTPRATTTGIPSAIPTATIGYQQTAIVAQATSAEAIRLMVAVTAEQDRRNFEQATWTVTAEAVNMQYQVMTQQAAQFTATAYATSIPATQTRQAAIDSARETEIQMTLIAPTLVYAQAQSKAYAEFADELQAAELVIKISIAVFIIALAMLLFVMLIRNLLKKSQDIEIHIPEIEPEPVPLVQDVKNENVLLRAEIPCTLEQLTELADGVINRQMTLAVNQWEGSAVHKSIKEIRAFFIQHHFAKVLVGKGGELGIEEQGEYFLSDVLRLGSPPPPYTTT